MTVETIFNGMVNIVMALVKVVLLPIDNLINSLLPQLSEQFTAVGGLLNLCGQSIAWVLSLFGLSPSVISAIISFYIFKFTLPYAVYLLKLVISWYNHLKW